MPLAEPHHVVVDGSNLATEGRTSPSLKQLDEAVRAYAAEDPGSSIIVVVDATTPPWYLSTLAGLALVTASGWQLRRSWRDRR